VGDIVTALISASNREAADGGVFNLGGGSQVEVLEVLEMMREITGRTPNVRHLEAQAGDVRMTGADTSLARTVLDFNPETTLGEGIAAQFDWVPATAEALQL
jgi:nucleoside-diphosphate-sugar epimerase